jgi:hypothetical protein
MGLIAVVALFSVFGFVAYICERLDVEKKLAASNEPAARAKLLAEYEERAALARLLPAAPVAPTSPPATRRRKVTKVEFMLGYRD